MLIPPFTIIIIKNPQRPITIRVTAMLVFVVLCALTLGALLIVTAHRSFMSRPVAESIDRGTRYAMTEIVSGQEAAPMPELTGIALSRPRNGDLELSFELAAETDGLYVWVVLNPPANSPGTSEVIPRNPLFRGVPVDYRNGMWLVPDEDRTVRVGLAGHRDPAAIGTVRILGYARDGGLVIDHERSVHLLPES